MILPSCMCSFFSLPPLKVALRSSNSLVIFLKKDMMIEIRTDLKNQCIDEKRNAEGEQKYLELMTDEYLHTMRYVVCLRH